MILIVSAFSQAQEGVENFLLAGKDAKVLAENYFRPGFQSFLYSVNNGWFTTAKVYRKFGFDITASASGALVPYDDRVFEFNPNRYNYLTTSSGGKRDLPTIMAHDEVGAKINFKIPYKNDTYKVASFAMPEGVTEYIPLKTLPMPMLQFGFGLPFETDIKLRFVPSFDFAKNDIEAEIFGVAIQHDLTHYFGIDYEDSRFGLSIMGGYTSVNTKYNFYNDKIKNKNIEVSKDAAMAYLLSAWNAQLLGSMDFDHISFYLAYGYQEAYSKLELEGKYDLTYDVLDRQGKPVEQVKETVENPFRLDFDETGTNKITAGAAIILGKCFKIYGEYVIQEPYNSVGTGVSLFFK